MLRSCGSFHCTSSADQWIRKEFIEPLGSSYSIMRGGSILLAMHIIFNEFHSALFLHLIFQGLEKRQAASHKRFRHICLVTFSSKKKAQYFRFHKYLPNIDISWKLRMFFQNNMQIVISPIIKILQLCINYKWICQVFKASVIFHVYFQSFPDKICM